MRPALYESEPNELEVEFVEVELDVGDVDNGDVILLISMSSSSKLFDELFGSSISINLYSLVRLIRSSGPKFFSLHRWN